ncbi:three component ABC system middle component [Sphingobium rhizovicinum]|uniref:Three component ABC system middle component n=1 Tax=Sphingobium rhizovicinum TaxID=432308 RepID=A0ABV7NNL1_9SPHN
MREDHEELVLRNPAFVSCALWYFARTFSDSREGRSPTLAHMVLATAMLLHERTVEKIARMQFESGLLKAVVEEPELFAGLQRRVEAALPVCLTALQVGVSTQLLMRDGDSGLPAFRAGGAALPIPIRQNNSTNSAARRLGAWIAADDLPILQARLGVKL